MKSVTVRDEGTIRYLELNNAATKNSLDLMMAEHLLAAIVEANTSTECKVIVFSSTGRAYFSMGPDLEQLINLTEQDHGQKLLDQVVTVLNHVIMEIYQSPKITVAAVHGFAYGGGLNIMLACDYRLTVNNAKFIENFLYMGVTPDLSSSYFLTRLIGITKTTELIFTGRLFSGQEATEWGMFQECFPKRSEMMERVAKLGEQFNSLDLVIVSKMKELLRISGSHSLNEQLEIEKQSLLEVFQHPTTKSKLLLVHNKKMM